MPNRSTFIQEGLATFVDDGVTFSLTHHHDRPDDLVHEFHKINSCLAWKLKLAQKSHTIQEHVHTHLNTMLIVGAIKILLL